MAGADGFAWLTLAGVPLMFLDVKFTDCVIDGWCLAQLHQFVLRHRFEKTAERIHPGPPGCVSTSASLKARGERGADARLTQRLLKSLRGLLSTGNFPKS